ETSNRMEREDAVSPLASMDPDGRTLPPARVAPPTSLPAQIRLQAPRHHTTPLAGRVKLTIAAHRSSYCSAEPLQLSIAVRNTGGRPVRGAFALDPASGELEIWYRTLGTLWQRLGRPMFWGSFVHRPRVLEPGAELSEDALLAFDHAR